jgi:hypothetical protein
MEPRTLELIVMTVLGLIQFLTELNRRKHSERTKILEAKLEQLRTILGVIESDQ